MSLSYVFRYVSVDTVFWESLVSKGSLQIMVNTILEVQLKASLDLSGSEN